MNSPERFRPYVAAMLLLVKDDKVLLQRRFKTGYADGWYNPVSGHVDAGEFTTQSVVREAKEEAGIVIDPSKIKLVHTQQLVPRPGSKEFIYFYFECKEWKGEPKIMEPEKHDDLSWFAFDALPENTIPYIKYAIDSYRKNISYTETNIETWNHLLQKLGQKS